MRNRSLSIVKSDRLYSRIIITTNRLNQALLGTNCEIMIKPDPHSGDTRRADPTRTTPTEDYEVRKEVRP